MGDDAARAAGLSDGSSGVKADSPAGKEPGRVQPRPSKAAGAALRARVAGAAKKSSTAKLGDGWRAAQAAKGRGNKSAGWDRSDAAKAGPRKYFRVPEAGHGAPQPEPPSVQGAMDRLRNPSRPQSEFARSWAAAHFSRPVATKPVFGNRGLDSPLIPGFWGPAYVGKWAMAPQAPDRDAAKKPAQVTGGGETNNNTNPYDLFGQWVTGNGPRNQNFTNGDPITEELRRHSHMAGVRSRIRKEINSGRAFRDFGGMQVPN